MDALLGADGVLALPTAPGPAPVRGMTGEALDAFRWNTLSLTVIAGMGGLPQVRWGRRGSAGGGPSLLSCGVSEGPEAGGAAAGALGSEGVCWGGSISAELWGL